MEFINEQLLIKLVNNTKRNQLSKRLGISTGMLNSYIFNHNINMFKVSQYADYPLVIDREWHDGDIAIAHQRAVSQGKAEVILNEECRIWFIVDDDNKPHVLAVLKADKHRQGNRLEKLLIDYVNEAGKALEGEPTPILKKATVEMPDLPPSPFTITKPIDIECKNTKVNWAMKKKPTKDKPTKAKEKPPVKKTEKFSEKDFIPFEKLQGN